MDTRFKFQILDNFMGNHSQMYVESQFEFLAIE